MKTSHSASPDMTRREIKPLAQRQFLVDDVHDVISGLLMDGVVVPDERITIDTLARQLGVSPTPVREALARLESDGLVVKHGLRGYFATAKLTTDEVKQLYEFRLLLEPWAAGRAAERADVPGKRALLDEIESLPTAPSTTDYAHLKAMYSHDSRFHELILDLAGNQPVQQSMQRNHCHLHLFRLQYGNAEATYAASESLVEHRSIADAIGHSDMLGAEEAMRDHLLSSRDRIIAALG
ncbi:MAG: hypothetical protein JW395_3901 [Nitrospira sp.]|nr:hypothetical protein [Nitrospira sp.]